MVSYIATTMRSGIDSAKTVLREREKRSVTRRDVSLAVSCQLRKDDLTVARGPKGSAIVWPIELGVVGVLKPQIR